MLFIKLDNGWWEVELSQMQVYNYFGGWHPIKEETLKSSTIIECNNWSELYKMTNFNPLEVNIRYKDVWISPDGRFYNGDAHENRAEEILEIMYNQPNADWPGDRLEELGWIRATTSLMWEYRLKEFLYKRLTQKQYDALWDWCIHHKKEFPDDVIV